MKSTALALFAAVMLVVSAAAIVNAGNSDTHRITEILIEKDWHHIGDGEGFSSFLIPDAEGTEWETAFRIPDRVYETASSAHLELVLRDSEASFDSVVINGRSFALPDTRGIQVQYLPYVSKNLISIPVGLLRAGNNTIGFEAGQLGPNPPVDNTHDDFEFGELVLLLSS